MQEIIIDMNANIIIGLFTAKQGLINNSFWPIFAPAYCVSANVDLITSTLR